MCIIMEPEQPTAIDRILVAQILSNLQSHLLPRSQNLELSPNNNYFLI